MIFFKILTKLVSGEDAKKEFEVPQTGVFIKLPDTVVFISTFIIIVLIFMFKHKIKIITYDGPAKNKHKRKFNMIPLKM